MNTLSTANKKIARVAINVRLYFDVPIDSEDPADIGRAARQEFERVADDDRIRVRKLKFPNIYTTDAWRTVKLDNFDICGICPVGEATRDTRFEL